MLPISRLKATDCTEDEPAPPHMPSRPRRASRAAGIVAASVALWPEGPPPWLSVKERDAEIITWLKQRGVKSPPSVRTIRRILNSE